MTEPNQLMTVGQLAVRTGLSIKSIRELEGRGLIYTAGRSPANYRLFDESALWCAQVIGSLRSLGLTIKEIEQLAGVYLDRPDEPIGPHLAALVERAEQRIEERIRDLEQIRERIRRFRSERRDVLGGAAANELTASDPRRRSGSLDSAPGVRPYARPHDQHPRA
ncbi:MAG TPA: MerR family transcriptional regulator [Solirubrobacteraceae bacterium]|jgi:DNA-binding transcriptional MerR regulator